MRVLALLDWPTRSGARQGGILPYQIKTVLERMNPDLDIEWRAILSEEPPMSQSSTDTYKSIAHNLNTMPVPEHDVLIGFGRHSAHVLTGTDQYNAWGQPRIWREKTVYGFTNLGVVTESRGVMIPILHLFLNRITKPHPNPFDSSYIAYWPEHFLDVWAKSGKVKQVAIDIENNPRSNTIMKIGLAWRSQFTGKILSASLPWDAYSSGKFGPVSEIQSHFRGIEAARLVAEILANPDIVKIGHNVNHDVYHLESRSLLVHNTEDTMVAHQVIYPDAPHNLGFVGCQYAAAPAWKEEFSKDTEEKGVEKFQYRNEHDLATYNAKDCIATLIAWEKQIPELDQVQRGWEYYAKNKKLYHTALKMHNAGIYWDRAAEQRNRDKLNTILSQTESVIRQYIPQGNYNSTGILRRYFYQKKQCAVLFQTDKGVPQVNKDAIGAFKADPRPEVSTLAKAIESNRNARKFLSTYLDKVFVHPDGRVHPDVFPNDAKTGRWKIRNPEIQTTPQKMIRDCYAAPEGSVIIYPDYSQLELRVVAAMAKDLPMIETFAQGIRIHTQNTKDVFTTAYEPGNKQQENLAKTTVFTINYGGTYRTIHQRLVTAGNNVTEEFCERLIANWFEKHPALKTYLDQTYRRACKDLYVELPLSKRRLTWWRRPRPSETANQPIQGTAADIVDEAIMKFSDRIDWKDTLLIGQVHDAMLVQTKRELVVETCELLRECMERTWNVEIDGKIYPLKFTVGYNIGKDWLSVKEFKTVEAVREEYGR